MSSDADLIEAVRLVRMFERYGQHPGRPAVAAVLAEYDRRGADLRAQRDAVLALHRPYGSYGPPAGPICTSCMKPENATEPEPWPCPTARAAGVEAPAP